MVETGPRPETHLCRVEVPGPGSGQGRLTAVTVDLAGAHERAAVGIDLDRPVQRAAAHEVMPTQEPDRPAVAPRACPRAAGDRDRVTGNCHAVVGLGVG